ncbi:class I SAM-dependent methyltransferase [Desulfobacula toluolica]|uniref:TehB: predicted tellurite resistance protein n=1 Tax=Desulfobacula toluolica (strain DSM 7467 / Tol2) TaxID=651182 RepID=K0NN50_DESTT|nr:class I SAM-dependent methyltransferase [Desulfobacula toluolica]CCK82030.1 TehB: predicted tellurite resistance protein [Desulfobacula toluolica Tol2]
MTEQDQKKWNERYLNNIGNQEPSDIILKYVSLAPTGNALDIACGNGRNSKFLAQKGFHVDAVDISNIALSQFTGDDTHINVICQDIDTWQIPQNHYQLIINIRFLDRRLFPMIKNGLKPGGVLIFESFIDDKKDYCLKSNELLHAFKSFRIVYYEKKENEPSEKFDQSVYFVGIKK